MFANVRGVCWTNSGQSSFHPAESTATASAQPTSSSADNLMISTPSGSPEHTVTAPGLSLVEKFLAELPEPLRVVRVDRVRQDAERARSHGQHLGVRYVGRVHRGDVDVLAVHPAVPLEFGTDRTPHLR